MFVIQPPTKEDFKAALALVGEYRGITPHVILKNDTITITVDEDNEDERLCEMAFQMNFHQGGCCCVFCAAVGDLFCGHLTFTSAI